MNYKNSEPHHITTTDELLTQNTSSSKGTVLMG